MWKIDSSSIDKNSSPLKLLLKDLPRALVNIAPERGSDFVDLHPDFRLVLLDDKRWTLKVSPQKKEIHFDVFVLEYLWVLAYVHFRYYTKVIQPLEFDQKIEIKLSDYPELEPDLRLLDWAMDLRIGFSKALWPHALPHPDCSDKHDSDNNVASEIALGAAAFMLHHKFAHLALEHHGTSEVQIENEADAFAWDWALDSFKTDNCGKFQKRMLLCLHSTLQGVARDVRLREASIVTHPRYIDRATNLLARYDIDPNSLPFAMAFSTIHFYTVFSERRMDTPAEGFDSFKEAFEWIADFVSKYSS